MSRQDAACARVRADEREKKGGGGCEMLREAKYARTLVFEFNAWFSKPIFPHICSNEIFVSASL